MQVVPVPAALDDRSLDQLAAGLPDWPPRSRLLIDAHATKWASPAGFVALLSLGQALQELRLPKPGLNLPQADHVTSYWGLAGLIEHAAAYYELYGKIPRQRSEHAPGVLIPVTPIREAEDVHGVIEAVDDRLTHLLVSELGLAANVVGGFSQSLSEMTQNVVEHAGTNGWVSVQIYNFRRRLGRKVAVIAVSDAGVGFRSSLEASQARRFGDRWSDGVAIETALIHNISRFRDPGRGQGLASTKRYLARWQGKISVRSGTARVALAPPWDDEPARSDDLPYFPGSQVTIVIPAREGES